jgi:iron complex outermembrane recepter protein
MGLGLKQLVMISVAIGAFSRAGAAQEGQPDGVEEIVITGDPLKLIEKQDSDTVYGLSKPYLETPRSISVVSDATIDRYNIETVNDLIATTPGTFTGSFFGVPGSPTVRGARADSYFRGFKRVENPGTFPMPIGASERIEIVRGPTPTNFGAGRIGGLLNFVPHTEKTARMTAGDSIVGSLTGVIGSYNKQVVSGDLGVPFELGGRPGGLYAYGEFEDSRSFYRGITPERALVQLSFEQDLGDATRFEMGGMSYSSSGYLQTLGWNRVTQDLIDNGTYITGQDTDLVDLNGDGRLQPGEVDAVVGAFFGASNIRQFVDFGVFVNPAFELDAGLGTTQLDRRTTFVSGRDIADTNTLTGYADLTHDFAIGKLRVQAFYDNMDAQLHQSYGYAADYQADVVEGRVSYEFDYAFADGFAFDGLIGASHRKYDNETKQTFLSGYLVVDRRDLSVGATANDIFDDPFSTEAGSIGWDTDLTSSWSDTGVFFVGDVTFWGQFDLLFGLRYDRYKVDAINTGATIFDPALGNTLFADEDADFTYEVAVTWRSDMNVAPYIIYAENSALETNDAGGIEVDRIAQGNFLADSQLLEGGMKFDAAGGRLTGGWALFKQERTRVDPFGNVDGETSEGFELEVKALLSEEWSFTGVATLQQSRIEAPGVCFSGNGEFVVIPPARVGISGSDGYGGLFAALNASCLSELQQGYERTTLPEQVYSAFFTYTSPEGQYGSFGYTVGGTYVSETGGKTLGAHEIPAYFMGRIALFWQGDRFGINGNVTNIFDEEYFIPVQNVFEEVGVLPSKGREFKIALTARF